MERNKISIIIFLMSFALVSRLIPHPSNFTPLTALCVLAGRELNTSRAVLILFLSLFISDGLIAGFQHNSWLGNWTFYTYSGFVLAIALGKLLHRKVALPLQIVTVMIAGFSFWIWSNFGVWLVSGLYPFSSSGLIACYAAALPFLQNQISGDLVWGFVIFGSYVWALQKKPLLG